MSPEVVCVELERGKLSKRGSRVACQWVEVAVLCGVMTLGVLWLLHHLAARCHTRSLDHRVEARQATLRTQQNGVLKISYSSYWSLEDDKYSRMSRARGAMSTVYRYNNTTPHSLSVDPQEETPAQRLHRLLTHPTTSCRKLIRVGGRSCLGAYDGSKLVCLDEWAGLVPQDCLVYSFGIGHDFTFDEHMQDLGCEVHAFDHDADHEHYDYRLGPTAFFHKARIGPETGYMRSCDGDECDPLINYLTLADIIKSLDHGGRRLSYLKMDIESEEWPVLSQILQHHHSSATLASTAQLSLEIHIELHGKTLSEKRALITSCLAILENLANLGFKLLTYEENELNPQYEDIDGAHLGLYAEILLLRTNRNHPLL
uniref:Methyltransferase domain-containing protein n=1 Tax=Scylla olivacea TaxID=85551 RepID=A0A0P4WVM6_SCYOL